MYRVKILLYLPIATRITNVHGKMFSTLLYILEIVTATHEFFQQDFESNEENVLISYIFNGVSQGVAFEVAKEQLESKALFPHVLSKNISLSLIHI